MVYDYPPEQGGWQKNPLTPVLGSKELGTCFDVNVHQKTDGYRMYFSWRPKASIAFVESADGIHWNEPVIILGPRPETGWEMIVNRNCVLYHDGKYRMWYTGQNLALKSSKIGYAESLDGIHYDFRPAEPVLIPDAPWETESVMNPFVLFDSERQLYRMWYAAGETYEPNVICYAESKDGIAWTKFTGNPIFVHGEKPYDQNRIGGCEVTRLKDGSFLMFYIGYEDINTARIAAAKSPDGITNWVRLDSNPIVSPTRDAWDADACYKPSALYDEKSGCWYLWYNGRKAHDEFIGRVVHPGYELGI